MRLNNIIIKKIDVCEVDKLQAIGRQTFEETFAFNNSKSQMEKYLTENFNTSTIKSELEISDSHFYFAELEGSVIGYLKVNTGTAQTENSTENGLEIERIYVLKEYYGKQVGQRLYKKALNVAESSGVDFIWLGVWENNPRAIRFYEKQGFVNFGKHIFKLGTEDQTDILMKRALL
jgi:ribosomal protein S18 acetylase RimI-like enzyme